MGIHLCKGSLCTDLLLLLLHLCCISYSIEIKKKQLEAEKLEQEKRKKEAELKAIEEEAKRKELEIQQKKDMAGKLEHEVQLNKEKEWQVAFTTLDDQVSTIVVIVILSFLHIVYPFLC